MATSIFSIIDGLTVDKNDILEAEIFAEQYLSSQFPTYDFRQGTAIRDMTVRPNATLLALVNKAIKYYFDETDVINMTNDTDSDIVDSRLSNFFITRKSGNNSVVKARLYFAFPTTTPIATIIPNSSTFSTDNVTVFNPVGSISVNPDPGLLLRNSEKYYFSFDASSNLHYVDINLAAQVPSEDSNLTEGDLLYFTLFSPYFVSGEILYLLQTAVETETNEEMVDRAYNSISTRNLINTPSIESSISDQFNFVGQVYPVGLGSDDLYRDLITIPVINPEGEAENTTFHKGGHVDVYVDTPLATQRVQLTIGQDLTTIVAGPVVSIRRAPEAQSGKVGDTVPLGVDYCYTTSNTSTYTDGIPDVPALDLSLSTRQNTVITVPLSVPGDTMTFDVDTYSGLNSVSSAINSDEQRVVCADYMVRAFNPVYLNIKLDVRDVVDEDVLTKAVTEYISSIKAGGTIYMANLVSTIQESGLDNFVMPIDVDVVETDRFRQYDSSDESVTDSVTTKLIDKHSIRTTQMFKLGSIELTEV